jgi:hypothetical protein
LTRIRALKRRTIEFLKADENTDKSGRHAMAIPALGRSAPAPPLATAGRAAGVLLRGFGVGPGAW